MTEPTLIERLKLDAERLRNLSRIETADPKHQEFLDALQRAVGAEGASIDAVELLAIASQFIGQLIAMQDARQYTADGLMQVVMNNIEIGNIVCITANTEGLTKQ